MSYAFFCLHTQSAKATLFTLSINKIVILNRSSFNQGKHSFMTDKQQILLFELQALETLARSQSPPKGPKSPPPTFFELTNSERFDFGMSVNKACFKQRETLVCDRQILLPKLTVIGIMVRQSKHMSMSRATQVVLNHHILVLTNLGSIANQRKQLELG